MQSDISSIGSDYEQSLETYWSLAQTKFYASERCRDARRMLQELIDSPDHETGINYFEVEFKERHLDYLSKHPRIDLVGYISNLKLMTRKRNVYKG